MADHDESLIDKAKRALGFGDESDERRDEVRGEVGGEEPRRHDDLDADRADGWAGVPDAAGVGTQTTHGVEGVRDDDVGLHTARSGAEADTPYRDTTEDQFAGSGYDTSYGAGTDRVTETDETYGSGTPEMGVGLDREGTSGTGERNTGTGLDYDFEERTVTENDPAWTRGEAASGRDPLTEGGEPVDEERRESGL